MVLPIIAAAGSALATAGRVAVATAGRAVAGTARAGASAAKTGAQATARGAQNAARSGVKSIERPRLSGNTAFNQNNPLERITSKRRPSGNTAYNENNPLEFARQQENQLQIDRLQPRNQTQEEEETEEESIEETESTDEESTSPEATETALGAKRSQKKKSAVSQLTEIGVDQVKELAKKKLKQQIIVWLIAASPYIAIGGLIIGLLSLIIFAFAAAENCYEQMSYGDLAGAAGGMTWDWAFGDGFLGGKTSMGLLEKAMTGNCVADTSASPKTAEPAKTTESQSAPPAEETGTGE